MKNKYRILIVEDDEVIARSVQKLMEDWGWEACCVEISKEQKSTQRSSGQKR